MCHWEKTECLTMNQLLSRKKDTQATSPLSNLPSDLQAAHMLYWPLLFGLCLYRPPLTTCGRSPPFMQECLMLATHLSGP